MDSPRIGQGTRIVSLQRAAAIHLGDESLGVEGESIRRERAHNVGVPGRVRASSQRSVPSGVQRAMNGFGSEPQATSPFGANVTPYTATEAPMETSHRCAPSASSKR